MDVPQRKLGSIVSDRITWRILSTYINEISKYMCIYIYAPTDPNDLVLVHPSKGKHIKSTKITQSSHLASPLPCFLCPRHRGLQGCKGSRSHLPQRLATRITLEIIPREGLISWRRKINLHNETHEQMTIQLSIRPKNMTYYYRL